MSFKSIEIYLRLLNLNISMHISRAILFHTPDLVQGLNLLHAIFMSDMFLLNTLNGKTMLRMNTLNMYMRTSDHCLALRLNRW